MLSLDGLARRREIRQNTDSQSTGDDYANKSKTITHSYGICTEIYPKHNATRVVSPKHGEILSSYLTELGLKKGDLVEITIIAGVPSVTNIVKFGFSPSKTILLNLSPKKDEKAISVLKGDDVPWGESEGEKISLSPVVIDADMGEKVYNVGLNGIKIGHALLTIFSKMSRIMVLENTILLVSKRIKMITKGFSLIGGVADKLGFKSESIYEENNSGGLDGVVFDFKGNISRSISDVNITVK